MTDSTNNPLNKPLAEGILEDIQLEKFVHDQISWARSMSIRPNEIVDFGDPKEDTTCGAAFCFAGRAVIRSKREVLYNQEYLPNNGNWENSYSLSSWATALESDINSDKKTRFSDADGYLYKMVLTPVKGGFRREFFPYEGNYIHISDAAQNDLGVNGRQAEELFHLENSFHQLKDLVEFYEENPGETAGLRPSEWDDDDDWYDYDEDED